MQGFRTGIAAGFTGIIAVQAGRNFQRLNQSGVAGVDSGGGNHAIHCDDLVFLNGTELFDAVNSWGANYGINGRAYLHQDSFTQTFGRHTFYLIGSTEEK
jgi:C1A family cysteine protease